MQKKNNKSLILNEIKINLGFKTQKEFAAFLGVNEKTLSSWYSRDTIDYELVSTKCRNISAEFLLRGEGEVLRGAQPKQASGDVSAYLEIIKSQQETISELVSKVGGLTAGSVKKGSHAANTGRKAG